MAKLNTAREVRSRAKKLESLQSEESDQELDLIGASGSKREGLDFRKSLLLKFKDPSFDTNTKKRRALPDYFNKPLPFDKGVLRYRKSLEAKN